MPIGYRRILMLVLALLLTVLTGFSGLVYEVTWQKYLAVLLGSHREATAAVLGIFLGGLALGYSLFGRVTHRVVEAARTSGRTPRLLLLYGVVEGGIGVYALLFPLVFGAVQSLSASLPGMGAGPGFAIDVGLAALLIGPPTVLMGGTIPILTQALSRGLDDATRVHAWIYAFNTAGAFLGALAAGFVLVHWLGLDGVLYAMGGINLIAGTIFISLDGTGLGRGRFGAEPLPTPAAPGVATHFAAYALVAVLGGFAMMTVQTVLIRIGGLSLGASHFTFATVVAVFVLCIALGSFAVSALPRISPRLIAGSQWALVGLLVVVYWHLDDAPYWAHLLRSMFRDADVAFYPFYLSAFAGLLLVLAVPIGLSGALLPLLFHHLRREYGDLGGMAGRLYSANTVGSLLGALLGGYALFFWLDMHHVFRVALVALVAGASILTIQVVRVSWQRVSLLATLPAVVVVGLLPGWDPTHLASGLFRMRAPLPKIYSGVEAAFGDKWDVIFYDDDPTTSVAVKERELQPGVSSRAIVTDGKPDGALILDLITMSLAGLLPALFAETPERAFVIGYGTGTTAGELAALDEVELVEVADISQGVLDAAPLFDHGNLDASLNPKVKTIRSDAYRALLRGEGDYDIIVSEPSNPWRTGVEMLFSQEFLQTARGRLRPGGVYVQWLHLYEMDEETVELILRTYASVFDVVSVWFTYEVDILLLGFVAPDHALDLPRLEARFARPDFQAGMSRLGITSLAGLLAHELIPVGVVSAMPQGGEIHTIRRPVLSHQAARAFFRGQTARLPKLLDVAGAEGRAQNSLLQRLAGRTGGTLPENTLLEATRETCRHGRTLECTALLASWWRDHPDSDLRRRVMAGVMSRPGRQQMEPREIAAAVALFGGEAPSPAPAVHPLMAAQQATRRYTRFYHYAVPFSPAALRSAWNVCESPPESPDACATERALSETRIDSLGSR